MSIYNDLNTKAKLVYDTVEDFSFFFAPGRVNLIGEHIDYNGGYVLPFALEQGTYIGIKRNNSDCFNFYSENFMSDGVISISKNNLIKHNKWIDYPLGMIKEFFDKGFDVPAIDFYFYGNIPIGASLSSSASIEVATALALNDLLCSKLPSVKIVIMAKSVENKFIGINSGIMDQFAVTFAKCNQLVLLNCKNLDHSLLTFNHNGCKVVIVNTNKSRQLIFSKYNERYAECMQALSLINNCFNKQYEYLCDIPAELFEKCMSILPNDILKKRFKHVITENFRVLSAVKMIKEENLVGLGKLLFESHKSLRYDYDVTGLELDTIVDTSFSVQGVLGARVNGGGFGGCAIALVYNEFVDNFVSIVTEQYQKILGYSPSFIIQS